MPEAEGGPGSGPVCRLLVTGGHGLIGSEVVRGLRSMGHSVRVLTRQPRDRLDFGWDPEAGWIDPEACREIDGVIHLAGEGIADGRWSMARKRRMQDSRVRGTALLVRTLCANPDPPSVLVSASAVGYYPFGTTEACTEEDAPGDHFLANICRDWESATQPASACGIRVCRVRIGLVLSARGGALPRLRPAFSLGMGAVLGEGTQRMAWISLQDVASVLVQAALDPAWQGAINAVAPDPCTNRDFARTLGRVLRRPVWLRLPPFALRLALGEMAEATLLADTHVRSSRLHGLGFRHRFPDLEGCLRAALRPGQSPADGRA